MKAMILAAGKGERMRPLTNHCPKPMLKVFGKPMLEHHILNLKAAGIREFVINLAWCGDHIIDYFGDGSKWQVNIQYSLEQVGELETAGGIIKALPFLGDDPFILVNGDVFCQCDYTGLVEQTLSADAHLCLVANPIHNPRGDFSLSQDLVGLPKKGVEKTYTYSGIAILSPALFQPYLAHQGQLALGPIFKKACIQNQVSGQVLSQQWTDVGTPERLEQLNQQSQQYGYDKEQ